MEKYRTVFSAVFFFENFSNSEKKTFFEFKTLFIFNFYHNLYKVIFKQFQ